MDFWQVLDSNEVSEIVLSNFHLDSFDICKQLVEFSREKGSIENVTVLLIKLDKK